MGSGFYFLEWRSCDLVKINFRKYLLILDKSNLIIDTLSSHCLQLDHFDVIYETQAVYVVQKVDRIILHVLHILKIEEILSYSKFMFTFGNWILSDIIYCILAAVHHYKNVVSIDFQQVLRCMEMNIPVCCVKYAIEVPKRTWLIPETIVPEW